ncbi:alpha/beta-hydrolase [Pseudovirgaria hyperparasitica]|uniref:Acyl-protein thioesterase 1 n=1 Tax=Pseudovirgaria hyperparasitica TaxID=470096 RepID=A0A6A6W2X3_9PEZI|nr:alpha/beta-hydrolase [Pseudovirgaria hyperparasitica]KAF2756310.1 alpha/beta-hydrolase [Pseudovirgaria hyperparasitica]
MASPDTDPTFSPPTIIRPISTHTHSLILLHGRGDTGPSFSLIAHAATSSRLTLRHSLPNFKFIFPTALSLHSTPVRRPMNQWFDYLGPHAPYSRPDLQAYGLRRTTAMLHELVTAEAEKVGLENVFVGGLSQGCAAALVGCMTLEGRIGGFVGMSGFLPLAVDFEGIDAQGREKGHIAVKKVKEIACVHDKQGEACDVGAFMDTPVFLGHGTADFVVKMKHGEKARDLLIDFGCDVTWKSYQEFGHWYKEPDEIDDILAFFKGVIEGQNEQEIEHA